MKNPKLDEIKTQLVRMLMQRFGYCGCADGDNQAMLNTGNGDDNFIITIKDQGALDNLKESKIESVQG